MGIILCAMKEDQPRRLPDSAVEISVEYGEHGVATVNLAMNETTFEPFRRAAERTGSLTKVFVGAVSLELLWDEI